VFSQWGRPHVSLVTVRPVADRPAHGWRLPRLGEQLPQFGVAVLRLGRRRLRRCPRPLDARTGPHPCRGRGVAATARRKSRLTLPNARLPQEPSSTAARTGSAAIMGHMPKWYPRTRQITTFVRKG
jgi:hypothetical protein